MFSLPGMDRNGEVMGLIINVNDQIFKPTSMLYERCRQNQGIAECMKKEEQSLSLMLSDITEIKIRMIAFASENEWEHEEREAIPVDECISYVELIENKFSNDNKRKEGEWIKDQVNRVKEAWHNMVESIRNEEEEKSEYWFIEVTEILSFISGMILNAIRDLFHLSHYYCLNMIYFPH